MKRRNDASEDLTPDTHIHVTRVVEDTERSTEI